jgi:Lon protease-like protein
MVRESLSGERLIAMALLKPGWERDYRGSPEFFTLGCLARFEEVEWLPDDCYDLKILGVSRVELGRMVREYPYRTARVRLLPQEPLPEGDPLVELERRALLDAYGRVAKLMAAEGKSSLEFDDPMPFEPLVNSICTALAAAPADMLALLELDSLIERSRRVREMLEEWLRRPSRERATGGEHN